MHTHHLVPSCSCTTKDLFENYRRDYALNPGNDEDSPSEFHAKMMAKMNTDFNKGVLSSAVLNELKLMTLNWMP